MFRTRQQPNALTERRVLIDALSAEVDLQRASASERASGLMTRASILVASASILTGLQSGTAISVWFILGISASALAALLGVVTMLPRFGDEVDVDAAEAESWNAPDAEALHNLMRHKLQVLKKDEVAMIWRRRVLLGGFASLALALVFATIHLSTSL